VGRLEQTLNKPIVVLVAGVVGVALNVLLYFGIFLPKMTPLIAHMNPLGVSSPEAIGESAPEAGGESGLEGSVGSVSDSPPDSPPPVSPPQQRLSPPPPQQQYPSQQQYLP
jgi:hypothetical protein